MEMESKVLIFFMYPMSESIRSSLSETRVYVRISCYCLSVLTVFFSKVLFLYVISGRIPFAFLEDIHQRFVRTYGRAVHTAQAYAMNEEFSRVLSQQIEYYSNDPNADRINRIKGEMNQV